MRKTRQVTIKVHLKVSEMTSRGVWSEPKPVLSFPVFERVAEKGKDLGQWALCGFRENAKFGAFSELAGRPDA